jgi:hypothetical protein
MTGLNVVAVRVNQECGIASRRGSARSWRPVVSSTVAEPGAVKVIDRPITRRGERKMVGRRRRGMGILPERRPARGDHEEGKASRSPVHQPALARCLGMIFQQLDAKRRKTGRVERPRYLKVAYDDSYVIEHASTSQTCYQKASSFRSRTAWTRCLAILRIRTSGRGLL